MKLTRQLIMEARTPRGAWNKQQLELIGVPWPPRQGWINRACEHEFTEESLSKFKELAMAKFKLKCSTKPKDLFRKIFDHMSQEHGLSLTESEINDIVWLVRSNAQQ